MDLYINGVGCISPQHSFDEHGFLSEVMEYETARLSCIEPDYTPYIDPKASRRMGRLLKYGTTAGLMALRDAKVAVPDAISTGTGFGLLDDSGRFLKSITEADEGVVSPTAFIQSTHNTVSSNIALTVGCRGHNNTFVHKGFSFESALNDAFMLMGEDPSIRNMLVGAYDETTDYSYAVMKRLRIIRDNPVSNLKLLQTPGTGTIAGEGAAFFALSKERSEHTYALLKGSEILYNPASADQVKVKLEAFLGRKGINLTNVDIVISGICGDTKRDEKLNALTESYFKSQTILGYKHLCGEYMTSSAFAMWMASMILKYSNIPLVTMLKDRGRNPSNILICNAYKKDYAFILLSLK